MVVCAHLHALLLLWDVTMGQVSVYSPTLPLKVALVPCPSYVSGVSGMVALLLVHLPFVLYCGSYVW
jgi:hypothetical protein